MSKSSYSIHNFLLLIIIIISLISNSKPHNINKNNNNNNNISDSNNKTLIFVYTHFRHGARAPITLDENFKDYFGNYWPLPEELTAGGERMHYILGYHNKLRYIKKLKFLKEKYDPHEIYIKSTNVNRTIKSATAQLQGLYNLTTGNKLLENQKNNFSYPPLNNISNEINETVNELNKEDYSLLKGQTIIPIYIFYEKDCYTPRTTFRDDNLKNNINITNITNYMTNVYGNKLNVMFEKKSKKVENFVFTEWNVICDQFVTGYYDGKDYSYFNEYNISLKDFTNDCENLLGIAIKDKDYGDKNREYVKYYNSIRLIDLFYYMKKRVYLDMNENNDNSNINIKDYSNPKFFMWSGHDTSVGALQIQFNEKFQIKSWINPGYASFVNLEVYRKNNNNDNNRSINDYEIHYYMNDKLLKIIDYKYFIDEISKDMMTYDEMAKYCKWESYLMKRNALIYQWIFIAIIILVVIFIILIIFFTLKLRKNYVQIDKVSRLVSSSENNEDI